MSEMVRMREYAEGGGQAQEERHRTHATAWVPTADIFAKGDDLVIRCELAGVYQDDIDVTLANGALTVSGERRSELDDEEPAFYTRERSFGHFRRTINLPDGVEEGKMDASFEDGFAGDHHRGRGQPAGTPAPPHPEPSWLSARAFS